VIASRSSTALSFIQSCQGSYYTTVIYCAEGALKLHVLESFLPIDRFTLFQYQRPLHTSLRFTAALRLRSFTTSYTAGNFSRETEAGTLLASTKGNSQMSTISCSWHPFAGFCFLRDFFLLIYKNKRLLVYLSLMRAC